MKWRWSQWAQGLAECHILVPKAAWQSWAWRWKARVKLRLCPPGCICSPSSASAPPRMKWEVFLETHLWSRVLGSHSPLCSLPLICLHLLYRENLCTSHGENPSIMSQCVCRGRGLWPADHDVHSYGLHSCRVSWCDSCLSIKFPAWPSTQSSKASFLS